MKIIENKYGLQIPDSLIDEYIENLIGQIYKILPIYENRDVKTKKKKSSEVDYENFQKYLQNLIFEVAGGFYIFDDNVKFLRLLLNLEGMQQIQSDEHEKLKSSVFKCIDICKKLKGGG